MKVGIDFGTTRTLVSFVDRGNYPYVTFVDEDGSQWEHFPSLVAWHDNEWKFGFAAEKAGRAGAVVLRSFKRFLSAADISADTEIKVGERSISIGALLTGFLSALRLALETQSNCIRLKNDVDWDAVVAVPAHACAAQRFLTLDAFQSAGFSVRAVMNEPSAGGFEFSHRQSRAISQRRNRVLVYDLGGGTFDASLVQLSGGHHEVLATVGHNRLGGDDFDTELARLVLQAEQRERGSLSEQAYATLLDACRAAKESIGPNTRRIVVDSEIAITIPVADYYRAVTPLVEQSISLMRPLIQQMEEGAQEAELAGIYLVGGASALPIVARMLRESFGRRVFRSPYPAASTALGLAIAADETGGFSITDRFSRSFGVFRERNGGCEVSFDPILRPDIELPREGMTVVQRRYQAAHNLGHFRFVECPTLNAEGEPQGELIPFGEVLFPFEAALREATDLANVPIERHGAGHWIEERYLIDPNGLVEFEIEDLRDGYTKSFALGGA